MRITEFMIRKKLLIPDLVLEKATERVLQMKEKDEITEDELIHFSRLNIEGEERRRMNQEYRYICTETMLP